MYEHCYCCYNSFESQILALYIFKMVHVLFDNSHLSSSNDGNLSVYYNKYVPQLKYCNCSELVILVNGSNVAAIISIK